MVSAVCPPQFSLMAKIFSDRKRIADHDYWHTLVANKSSVDIKQGRFQVRSSDLYLSLSIIHANTSLNATNPQKSKTEQDDDRLSFPQGWSWENTKMLLRMTSRKRGGEGV